MRTAVFAGALLTLTTGLAQDGANDTRTIDIEGGAPPAEEACFNVREARNFSALDDRFVYLEGARDEHFVLTVFRGCLGLEDSNQIAISNELSSCLLAGYGQDHLPRCRRQPRDLFRFVAWRRSRIERPRRRWWKSRKRAEQD